MTGWDGYAVITDAHRSVKIAATGARAFHLYRPPHTGFFCVEPVSHLPDALNRDVPIDILPPGATLGLALCLSG